MQWDPGRYTKDVDVVFPGPTPMLWKVVADVAEGREGVDRDWLNAAAQLMVPVPDFDPEPTLVYEGQNIHVYGASARYVLAHESCLRQGHRHRGLAHPTDGRRVRQFPRVAGDGRSGTLAPPGARCDAVHPPRGLGRRSHRRRYARTWVPVGEPRLRQRLGLAASRTAPRR